MNKHAKGNDCCCKTENNKSCGCNDWDSVPKTYDSADSCHEHKKDAGNNQWCSCSK